MEFYEMYSVDFDHEGYRKLSCPWWFENEKHPKTLGFRLKEIVEGTIEYLSEFYGSNIRISPEKMDVNEGKIIMFIVVFEPNRNDWIEEYAIVKRKVE